MRSSTAWVSKLGFCGKVEALVAVRPFSSCLCQELVCAPPQEEAEIKSTVTTKAAQTMKIARRFRDLV